MGGEYITLISPADKPTNFITQFDTTIALDESYEVGLSSIFHGAVCNICDDNNYFFIASYTSTDKPLNPWKVSTRLKIPTGFYKNTRLVVDAMKEVIDDFVRSYGKDGRWFSKEDAESTQTKLTLISKSKAERRAAPVGPDDHEVTSIKLELIHRDIKFYQPAHDQNTVLAYLGKYAFGLFSELQISNVELENTDEIGLIYCSLVKSSRLNNRNTNLLAVIPISRDAPSGYSYFSVTNPTYFPIAVTSFEQVRIEIQNVLQKPIHIQHMRKKDQALYPTILSLHLRKKGSK